MPKCKHHKTCPYYNQTSSSCFDIACYLYCGFYSEILERPEPILMDFNSEIHQIHSGKLLAKMRKMIAGGTWKWKIQPRKITWLDKIISQAAKVGKIVFAIMP